MPKGKKVESMKAVLVYITVASHDLSVTLAQGMVEEKLAACCNVYNGMTSIYSWQGDLCQDKEVTIIAKTIEDKFDLLVEYVKKNHDYSVPCILKIPVTGGNLDYLNWLTTCLK